MRFWAILFWSSNQSWPLVVIQGWWAPQAPRPRTPETKCSRSRSTKVRLVSRRLFEFAPKSFYVFSLSFSRYDCCSRAAGTFFGYFYTSEFLSYFLKRTGMKKKTYFGSKNPNQNTTSNFLAWSWYGSWPIANKVIRMQLDLNKLLKSLEGSASQASTALSPNIHAAGHMPEPQQRRFHFFLMFLFADLYSIGDWFFVVCCGRPWTSTL